MPVPSVALAFVAIVSAGLDVQGNATCPNPTDVAERIAPLLSPEQSFAPGVFLRVDEAVNPAEIEVRLESDGASAPLASRRLARQGSCGELAEAVAVVAASWAGRYETPSPPKLTPWETAAAQTEPRVVARPEPAPVPPLASAWSIGGAAGIGDAAEGGITPHGGVELTAVLRGTRWFGRILLGGTGERLFRVEAGNAGWWRILVMPSVGRSWGESVFFEASGGPVVGPVFVRGQGFSPNAEDVSLDVGVFPSARLGYRFGPAARTAIWLGGTAIAWLRPHRLSVDMSTNDAAIPWLDILAGAGATFDLWP